MSTEATAPSATASPPPRLTPQQENALNRGDVSVALSAGAGCGKTTVLAERFLQELDGIEALPLQSVVALTFTEKAARELRQRIRARCREKIDSGTEDEFGRWRTILRGLEAAPIGTFHEFCGRMLRAHAVESGLDPEFGVLDDSISRALRDQAIRSALRSALSERDLDLIDLAVDYGLGQIGEALDQIVVSVTLRDLETWVDQDRETILALWRDAWEREGRPALIRQAAHPARRCRDALTPLEPTSAKLRARREEILPLLADVITGRSPDSQLEDLKQLARISDLRGKDVWPSEEIKERIRKWFESLRKALDKIIPRLSWSERLTDEEIGNRQRLARLALKARREYERLKRERNGLDFDDLQIHFVDLLRERPEILADPSGAGDAEKSLFELILVDEFQDTDRIQSEILRRMGGSEFLTGRLFVVGDFKQSIYGFRGAEPSIFQDWRRAFPVSGRRELSENFRSVPGIIHFVNALFGECFEASGDDVPIIEGADRALNRLGSMRDAVARGPAVELLWADVGGSETDQTAAHPAASKPKRANAHELRRAESRSLAQHIRDRLDRGWTIFDRKTKQKRLAGPGDVAFLFRAMTDVGPYESALAEAGFDYHTIGGAAFFAQQEIHDIINVLSVIEDPLDEVALAGTLRSPFFSLSDDGLYWLATSSPGGLTAGLARAERIADLPPRDRQLAIRARNLLESWRGRKDREPIAALVGRVLDESGYEASLVCEFLGPRKLANTRKLVTMARGFDRQGGFLFADFIAQLRAHRDDPPREEQASTSDEEGTSVRLMSIHQSKGLEFPIVVLPDLDRSSERRNRLIAIRPELGLVVRPALAEPGDEDADPAEDSERGSLGWETCRALDRERDEQEALRLFYVATTRARDGLILSSGFSLDREPRSTAMRLLDERFDIRTGDCLAALPEDWPQPEVQVLTCTIVEADESDAQASSSANPARRFSLDEIREAIARVVDRPAEDFPAASMTRRIAHTPRILDLDQLDGLSSRSRRVERLIRTILTDVQLYQGAPLHRIAARSATRQFPAAHASLVRDAEALLRPWLESESFHRLRGLETEAIRLGSSWTIRRELAGYGLVVLRGSCDLFVPDAHQGLTPLITSLGGDGLGSDVHRAVNTLRLSLTGESEECRWPGPIGSGWILDLAHPGQPVLRREPRADPDTIDRTIAAVIAAADRQAD